MACGACPNCGTQMEETNVYGKKVCRCPDCGWKGPATETTEKKEKEKGKLEYLKSPKEK